MTNLEINREFMNKLFQVKLSEIRDDLKNELQALDSDNIQNKFYHQSAGYNRLINLIIKQTKKKSDLLLSSIFESHKKGQLIDSNVNNYINAEVIKLIDREISEKQHLLSDKLYGNRFPENSIKSFLRNLNYNAAILKGDFKNKIYVDIEIHNETIRNKSNVEPGEKKKIVIPDLEWFLNKSAKLNQLPRCPFASVEECPRYYQSLSLLVKYGNTSIHPKKDKKLQKKWEKSPYWPVVPEQATSISGSDNKHTYSLFCPELSYERFKLFASVLIDYRDLDEKEKYIEQLSSDNELYGQKDWRLNWAFIEPLHYSACSLFSLLSKKTKSKLYEEDVIDVKPNFFGLGLNLNALWQRNKAWIAATFTINLSISKS
jgi:hypothetical protein